MVNFRPFFGEIGSFKGYFGVQNSPINGLFLLNFRLSKKQQFSTNKDDNISFFPFLTTALFKSST